MNILDWRNKKTQHHLLWKNTCAKIKSILTNIQIARITKTCMKKNNFKIEISHKRKKRYERRLRVYI